MSDPMNDALTRAAMGIRDGRPLNLAGDGLEELQRAVQTLLDIEAIKQLKHAYFRCLDTANWEEIETLFHPDVSVHFKGGAYEWKLQGKDEYIASLTQSFHTQAIGHHNGHHPEIQILSDSDATGLWYLADHMWMLNHEFQTSGTAIYWDRYLKVDGRWSIKDTRYRRLYEINTKLDKNPPFSTHYLNSHAAEDPKAPQ